MLISASASEVPARAKLKALSSFSSNFLKNLKYLNRSNCYKVILHRMLSLLNIGEFTEKGIFTMLSWHLSHLKCRQVLVKHGLENPAQITESLKQLCL